MDNKTLIDVSESDKPLYDEIKKTEFFQGEEHAATFTLAMLYGYINDQRKVLPKKKHWLLRTEYLQTTDRKVLMQAIAVAATGDLEVIIDEAKVFNIAEEFANGGFPYLKEAALGQNAPDFAKFFEKQMVDRLKNTGTSGE